MTEFITGTSGWSYKHWQGIFYPEKMPSAKWLNFYSDNFRTVEVNMTFYKIPKQTVFENWAERTPGNFIFTIKAPRKITHIKRLKNIKEPLSEFYRKMEPLKTKKQCILFQLPPSYPCNDKNIERIDKLLKIIWRGYDHAFEFRHPSWWNNEIYSLFRDRAMFCNVNGLGLPDEIIATYKSMYIRFHGKMYDTLYSRDELEKIINEIVEISDKSDIRRVYLYFNNDRMGYAIKNAFMVNEILSCLCKG